MRILRRFVLLLGALLLPLYAISLFEDLEIPPAWHAIGVGDSHSQVRAHLREARMGDRQCEWLAVQSRVRCTVVGQHHAAGLDVAFDGSGVAARVRQVKIREPVYTGPFHLHARLRRYWR